MVFKYQTMDEEDDLEALRLAALQTIKPRSSRDKPTITNSKNQTDTAAFFRPISNPNLIAIVPVDSGNKQTVNENATSRPAPLPKYQNKKSSDSSKLKAANKEKPEQKVETKFSRFQDLESDSDDDSIDGEISFRNKQNKENNKQRSVTESDEDCLNLRDEDDDSLEKLMDQMEKEFNGTESEKDQVTKNKIDKSGPSESKVSNEEPKERETFTSSKEPKTISQDSNQSRGISSSPSRNLAYRKKSPVCRSSPKMMYSEAPPKDTYKKARSPVHTSKRSPYQRSRSPIRSKSRSPRRYSRRSSISPRRRSLTPRRKRSLSRSMSPSNRGDRPSPKRRFRSSKRRSVSPWNKSPSLSPRRKSVSPRKKSVSPKRIISLSSNSPRRRSFSPRMKSRSPRRRAYSPRRKSLSPRQRKVSPSYINGLNSPKYSFPHSLTPRSPSFFHSNAYDVPFYKSNSPSNCPVSNNHHFPPSPYDSSGAKYAQSRKRSTSRGRKSYSPVRKLNSPKHRRKSPRKSISPRDFNLSKKRSRSPRSPNRRSVSPRQRKVVSPRRKLSPVRRRSVSPRRGAHKSPLRAPAWSPLRSLPSPEAKSRLKKPVDGPKHSPINSVEFRGKERNERSLKITKLTKSNNGKQIEETKSGKEQKKKDDKKMPEPIIPEGPPDPVLEARRKKFESNNLVALTNKKIRLGPVINRVTNEEPGADETKNKSTPTVKAVNQAKNASEECENEVQSIDFSADILLLDTDYNLDESEEAKEVGQVLGPPVEKTRKLEVQTSVPPKRQLKKRTVNEEPQMVQKRKISVNIKPTALKALEEKSKKISEHKLIQENNKDTLTAKKSVNEKNTGAAKNSVSDNSTKRISHRQVKNSKEDVMENKEERSEAANDNKGIDLRAELCRRRAERLKGGPKLVPITRLLQSAFEGVVGNKAVRSNKTTSPEATVSPVKKKNLPTPKGRRVQVVQRKRLERVLESGSPESDGDEGIRDLQRNSCSHTNTQSGRSILHRNQV